MWKTVKKILKTSGKPAELANNVVQKGDKIVIATFDVNEYLVEWTSGWMTRQVIYLGCSFVNKSRGMECLSTTLLESIATFFRLHITDKPYSRT
jgi:hypothetical protein